ncbi:30S ribosomal protein S17 [Paludisphaera mucosa]|uniref:Small ribosomal subunit protein uS17 n=1 Tax=Paludisphaera mucosa TaxID=3030827 RepID=A0ABT6FI03_9BACT|nr:30S ribosomal protein S17 [Paludisphaera mucosa]MDG3007207.1 30S ribosomal protein S17 [Paludisphaera mucosa]
MSQPSPAKAQPTPARSPRKTEVGVVASDKMNKTRRVVVERLVPHDKYGKLMKRRTVCHTHDEANESHVGDLVEIMETRPLSKLKRWRLVRIIRKGAQQALAGEGEAAAAAPPAAAE